jgi:hypothetical protein
MLLLQHIIAYQLRNFFAVVPGKLVQGAAHMSAAASAERGIETVQHNSVPPLFSLQQFVDASAATSLQRQ